MSADRYCDVCGGAIYPVDASVAVAIYRGQSATLYVDLCDQCALSPGFTVREVIAGAIDKVNS